jgi:hypothetical protein
LLYGKPNVDPLTLLLTYGSLSYSNWRMEAEGIASAGAVAPRNLGSIAFVQDEAERSAATALISDFSKLIVDTSRRAGDLLAANPAFNKTVLRAVERRNLVSVAYLSNGGVSVRIGVALAESGILGAAADLLAPEARLRFGSTPKCFGFDAGTNYTSLVIDARGVDARSAFFPAIYDRNGNLLYGLAYADSSAVKNNGLVRYLWSIEPIHERTERLREAEFIRSDMKSMRSLSDLERRLGNTHHSRDILEIVRKANRERDATERRRFGMIEQAIDRLLREYRNDMERFLRIGTNPYYAVAAAVRGNNACDIVLGEADASVIAGNKGLAGMLRDCRAVIILRPE